MKGQKYVDTSYCWSLSSNDDILSKTVLPNLAPLFGGPVHEARHIKKCLFPVWCELHWPARSPEPGALTLHLHHDLER